MKLFVVTGPESSGKTSLVSYLSSNFDFPLISEYARTYLNEYGPEYKYQDLLKIANGQEQLEHEVCVDSSKNYILDTDLITIRIWSEFKYGKCDENIKKIIELYKNRYYLLCKPDIPWVFDELRENPDDRDELFRIYQTILHNYGFKYMVVRGNEKNRKNSAKAFIKECIGK